jgi:hypothetical protein
MPCNASYTRFIFLESFSYELQFDMHFYMHSYLHKIFILVKSGCYTVAPPPPAPEEINEEGPVGVIPEQEALMPHEVVPADVEPMVPQLRLYHALMRDYEENPLRLEDDFNDLDDDPSEDHSDMDE